MAYVLATVEVPGQERQYYAGLPRKIGGVRIALEVTHLSDYATRFATIEDAQAMLKQLDAGYEIVAVDA
jgi:hypothetical protein